MVTRRELMHAAGLAVIRRGTVPWQDFTESNGTDAFSKPLAASFASPARITCRTISSAREWIAFAVLKSQDDPEAKRFTWTNDEIRENIKFSYEESLPDLLKQVANFTKFCRERLKSCDPVLIKTAFNDLADLQNKAMLRTAEELSRLARKNRNKFYTYRNPEESYEIIDITLDAMRASIFSGRMQGTLSDSSIIEGLNRVKSEALCFGIDYQDSNRVKEINFRPLIGAVKNYEQKMGLTEGTLRYLLEACADGLHHGLYTEVANGGQKPHHTIPPLLELMEQDTMFRRMAKAFELPVNAPHEAWDYYAETIRNTYHVAFSKAFPNTEIKPEFLPSANQVHVQSVESDAPHNEHKAKSDISLTHASMLIRILGRKPPVAIQSTKSTPPITAQTAASCSIPPLQAPENHKVFGDFTANVARERSAKSATGDKPSK